MKARQLIEAEDPKAFIARHAPRLPMYYRFSMADGVFCFSVVAVDENQAVERANALLQAMGPSWELWDDPYINAMCYVPEDPATAANITTIDEVSDIFNGEPAEAVAAWEAKFKELIGG